MRTPHGSWICAADVGVMRTVGDVKTGALPAFDKDRHCKCDVGKMCPAVVWIVENGGIARLERELVESRAHRHRHRSKMYGHVITHGDHVPIGIENCAGVVAPLLNIR